MLPTFSNLQYHQCHQARCLLCLFVLLLVLVFIASLSIGEIIIWPDNWLNQTGHMFIWQLRLPRSLAVITVGAGLAVSGAIMQSLFDNPLAEPGLLGVANGSAVALILTIILGGSLLPVWLMSINAIFGALFLTLLLLFLSHRNQLTSANLLLVGVALSILSSAVMTWFVYFSTSLDLRQLMYWLMGSFSGIDWRQKWLIFSLLPAILFLIRQGYIINLLSLGEIQARQLGVSYIFWRNILVINVAWIIGTSVALAGVISFIGLVVPHVLRLSRITNQHYLLPACALVGAIVLLLADIISRTVLPLAELPIGVITATLGAPLFVWMLLSDAKT